MVAYIAGAIFWLVKRVPAAGYPLLFFRSRQGKIFLGVTVAVALLYFLLGVLDRRRELADVNMLSLATIVVEARELEETMQQTVTSARGPPPDAVAHPIVAQPQAEPAEPDSSALPAESRALHLAEFQLAPEYREEAGPEPEPELSTTLVPYVPPVQAGIDFAALEAEIHRAAASSAEVGSTMRELVCAIGEYGERLRSHTDVMKSAKLSRKR